MGEQVVSPSLERLKMSQHGLAVGLGFITQATGKTVIKGTEAEGRRDQSP